MVLIYVALVVDLDRKPARLSDLLFTRKIV